jgi:ubiquinone/menaquinone biosynthesis C-methylase UbiE
VGTAAIPWNDHENARRYYAFTRQYPQYQETSRDLVALAMLPGDVAVVDLACGTGVTTDAILSALGPDGTVTSVDGSAAMLAVAASSISDSRVTWVHARAENLDQHVKVQAGAVICNSAIWQTDLDATMLAVRNVLTVDGRFAFNIGSELLEEEEPAYDNSELLFADMMQGIAARDYGWSPPPQSPSAASRLSQETVCQYLAEAGFGLEQVERLEYQESPDAVRAWLSVPIFTKRMLPGLPYEHRMSVLDKAYEQLGPGEPGISRWVVFVAKVQ